MNTFLTAFDDIPDPRAENARHELRELLVVAFVSVLCGATSCVEMSAFGRAKAHIFRDFLKLKHAIPSHDTFSTVFRMIAPEALDTALRQVFADIEALLADGDVVAVDGKSLRGARDKGQNVNTRMMVSAYASRLRLTLASVPADHGAELDAVLKALGLIALKGKVVSADALHCNRRTIDAINARGGDWCLTLKANQGSLLSDAHANFSTTDADHPVARREEVGHGRKETRTATVVSAKGLAEHHDFPGLEGFGRIEATREINGVATSQTRFFALSWLPTPEVLLETVRAHWAVENNLHWQLDVSLREDSARNRKDNGAANLAVMRRRALDVVKRDTSTGSLSIKIKRAGSHYTTPVAFCRF